MMLPRIVTIECKPAPEGHIVHVKGELLVPVPEGWRVHTVLQVIQGGQYGMSLQVLLVHEPERSPAP